MAKLNRWCWFPSAILYVVALASPAVYMHGFGAPTSGIPGSVMPGYEMVLTLPFAMLSPSWWANPIWLVGIVFLVRQKFSVAWYCGLTATILALLVIAFGPVPPDFFKLENLHSGYYLWLSSMVALIAAAQWRCSSSKTTA